MRFESGVWRKARTLHEGPRNAKEFETELEARGSI